MIPRPPGTPARQRGQTARRHEWGQPRVQVDRKAGCALVALTQGRYQLTRILASQSRYSSAPQGIGLMAVVNHAELTIGQVVERAG